MARKTGAAIGVREHSGWAAVVALAGDPLSPAVVDRRRLELLRGDVPRQPYHAGSELGDVAAAGRLVKRAEAVAAKEAERGLKSLTADLARQGWSVVGLAVGDRSGRVPSEIARILPSHALLHAAEGELYREALADAASRLALPVTRYPPKGVTQATALALGMSAEELGARVFELGRAVGPPWRVDQKLAAAAAWLALASSGGKGAR